MKFVAKVARMERQDHWRRLIYVVWVLAAAATDGSSGLLVETKTAGRVGSELQLNCSKPDFQTSNRPALYWTYSLQDGTPGFQSMFYVQRGQVPVSDNSAFTPVDNTGAGPDYDVLFTLTQNLSTRYQCFTGDGNDVIWDVVGLSAGGMECLSTPATDVDVVMAEGDEVILICSVTYYQFSAANTLPKLTWSTSDVIDLGGVPTISGNTMTLSLNLTLQAENDDMSFTCDVSFGQDVTGDYSDRCPPLIFFVTHAVSRASIQFQSQSDTDDVAYVGDVINCTADGRPLATIAWFDESGVHIGDGDQLEVTSDMAAQPQPITLNCNATNSLDSVTYTVTDSLTFTAQSDPDSPGKVKAGTEAWVIVIAVVIPVVVIAAVIGGYFLYRYRKNKLANKKKPTTTSTSNRAATTYTPVVTNPPASGGSMRPAPPPANAPYGGYNPARTTPPNARPVSGHDSPAGHGALGVSMYTGSTQNLDTSYNSSAPQPASRPQYPYQPRNGAPAPAVNMNPNPGARPGPVGSGGAPAGGVPVYPYPGGPNRQASVASMASSRSSAHSAAPPQGGAYSAAPPQGGAFSAVPAYRSGHASLAGSEV